MVMQQILIKFFSNKRNLVRIMMGISPRSTCKPLFMGLRILSVPSQYTLSLMKVLVNNLKYLSCNNTIHTKFTRNRMCLHVPQTCQRGVYSTSVKIFNKLPKYIVDSVKNK